MDDYGFEIDILAKEIENKKKVFTEYQQSYFQDVYTVNQSSVRCLSWTQLFHQYLALANKYPNNAFMSLTEMIDKLEPETLWSKKYCLHKLYADAIDFSIKSQQYANERRHDAQLFKKQGFMFKCDSKNAPVAYSENFNVPNHADIAIETDNLEAALLLPDTLLRIPADPRLNKNQRTYAIKLLRKGQNPYEYLVYKNKLIKSFKLPDKNR